MRDVLIVGAGFGGMYMLHRLRGAGFDVQVVEAGPDVGGTWFWNRYPGARCDVESLEYSYSFDPLLEDDWTWTERFATQPEILAYARFVADRFDLRRDISFDTRVTGARWDEADTVWLVETDAGPIRARHLIMATGCLSVGQRPDLPGAGDFTGDVLHTGTWPADPPVLEGKRIGVIGTGSSGVQVIPELAKIAGHLTVFQRTPHFCVPARNAPISDERIADWRRNAAGYRARARSETRSGWLPDPALGPSGAFGSDVHAREYDARWQKGGGNFLYAFSDVMTDEAANDVAADYVRARIAEMVDDGDTAGKLTPTTYPIGAKRICVGTDYYETYNRKNVTLVDVADGPIEGFTPTGLRAGGRDYPLDVVVFATGFDAMTGALMRLDLCGRDGARLADKWDAGPANYLGMMTTDFPNFFMITGPGSPSVLSNVIVSIEQHVAWVATLLEDMRAKGRQVVSPCHDAERAWVDRCREAAERTLMGRANSWYLGANIPGKPRVFMPYIGGVDAYRRECESVAAEGYRGFDFSPALIGAG